VQQVASDNYFERPLVHQIRDDEEGEVVGVDHQVDERIELEEQLQERAAAFARQDSLHGVFGQAPQTLRHQVLGQVVAEDELFCECLLQLRQRFAVLDHKCTDHSEVLAELDSVPLDFVVV